ncbi:unnamed protein product [Brachionus calyciflorus]|uniref:C2H2-type domain-containing protein n=1 Tax=Brachionus calyciflorus TaxID=104777 RepID=A0A813M4L7_9BILA|nr:unnamed protein product [Brachionus calyciflorus]
MIVCYVCQRDIYDRKTLIAHLKEHETYGININPIKCKIDKCTNEYVTLNGLNRHIKDKHTSFPKISNVKNNKTNDSKSEQLKNLNILNNPKQNNEFPCSNQFSNEFCFNEKEDKKDFDLIFKSFQKKILLDILSLKSNNKIPETLLNQIITIFSDTHEMFLKLIQSSLSSIILNWEKNYYQEEIDKFPILKICSSSSHYHSYEIVETDNFIFDNHDIINNYQPFIGISHNLEELTTIIQPNHTFEIINNYLQLVMNFEETFQSQVINESENNSFPCVLQSNINIVNRNYLDRDENESDSVKKIKDLVSKNVNLKIVPDEASIESIEWIKTLTNVVAKYLIYEQSYEYKPTKAIKIEFAKAIITVFPFLKSDYTLEGWEHIYDPTKDAGYLGQTIRNIRSRDSIIPKRQ